jgi:flavin reductase (DIM6/NTAB) family NADH-FMN oxidoreductase RutF
MNNNLTEIQVDFKNSMSNFATGIAVVTLICDKGNFHGMTINSFNSISLDPVSVLYSLTKINSRFSIYKNCEKFAINILSNDQKDLAIKFASRESQKEKFENYELLDGIPIIKNTLTYMICKQIKNIDVGASIIIISEVLKTKSFQDAKRSRKPLVYFQREYYNLDKTI